MLNLSINLRRLKWFEELKLVRLYVFLPTHVKAMVTIDGVEKTQNQWIYSEVLKTIEADRIVVESRFRNVLGNPLSQWGLPELPEDYLILDNTKEPPEFFKKNAREFHEPRG